MAPTAQERADGALGRVQELLDEALLGGPSRQELRRRLNVGGDALGLLAAEWRAQSAGRRPPAVVLHAAPVELLRGSTLLRRDGDLLVGFAALGDGPATAFQMRVDGGHQIHGALTHAPLAPGDVRMAVDGGLVLPLVHLHYNNVWIDVLPAPDDEPGADGWYYCVIMVKEVWPEEYEPKNMTVHAANSLEELLTTSHAQSYFEPNLVASLLEPAPDGKPFDPNEDADAAADLEAQLDENVENARFAKDAEIAQIKAEIAELNARLQRLT